MTDAAPRNCVACGATPRTDFTLKNGEALLRCATCGLAWWNWPAFDPAAFYDKDYFQSDATDKGYNDYAALERGIRRTAVGRLRRIDAMRRRIGDARARAQERGRLLDLGCGTGLFLDEARSAGWSVAGYEVSEYGVSQAKARGLAVEALPVEGLSLPEASFDCVTMWDVIEHVRDPVASISIAARGLRSGGILAVSTGDITSLCSRWSGVKWHLFNLPEHLFFFSPDSLRRIVEKAGCEVLTTVNEINWVPVSYIVERLEKSLRMRLPLGRWLAARPWILPATLFDVMGIYARKR